jgi:hypothetical protein
MNKKGSLFDLFLFMALGFCIVIFMVIMTFVANTMNTKLHEQAPVIQKALGSSGNATEIIEENFGDVVTAYSSLRWISVMLIFGLMLSILLTSFLVKTNPVFFVPYVFIVVIAVIVSVPISNAYEVVYNNEVLASTFTGFFGVSWIFLHLPIWVSVIGILAGILMFANIMKSGNF